MRRPRRAAPACAPEVCGAGARREAAVRTEVAVVRVPLVCRLEVRRQGRNEMNIILSVYLPFRVKLAVPNVHQVFFVNATDYLFLQ